MIVLQFDAAYFHWGLLMVRSLALHEPRKKVLANTVNLNNTQQARLAKAHPQIQVISETIASAGSLREEMARRKTIVLQRAMDSFPEEPWFGMFDADMLVRRPLPDLWSKLNGHQAALIRTNGMWAGRFYPHLLIPSGIVLVRRDGRALVENWVKWSRHVEPLFSRRPGEWFWDQCTLVKAWKETSLCCANISMQDFASATLARTAAIWSAHVPEKENLHHYFLVEHELQRVRKARPG
jgi:hypothetical protein